MSAGSLGFSADRFAVPVAGATGRGRGEAAGANEETLAAAFEVLSMLDSIDEIKAASDVTAHVLSDHLSAGRVLIGWREREKGNCRIVADTAAQIRDMGDTESAKAQAALDEVILCGRTIGWPVSGDQGREVGQLAVEGFAKFTGAKNLIGSPLVDHEGRAKGAWVFVDVTSDPQKASGMINAISRPFGGRLAAIQRNSPGPVLRVFSQIASTLSSMRTGQLIAGLLLLLALTFLPITYNVRCDCIVQPKSRRFVAAPFDGALEQSLVKPGDVVQQDMVLARMSAREFDWELAALKADLDKANKERKVSLAGGDFSKSQIADLESQRLKHKADLLEHRIGHLEIRSPIQGIVVSGDNKESEGAPLQVGQTLFEIAPIGEVIIQMLVPEEDYVFVREGMPVSMRLHAFPSETLEGTVTRIQPAAEIMDNENVFVAELTIEDPHALYRPGMRGRAAIASDLRPLLWIVMHKPVNALWRWIYW